MIFNYGKSCGVGCGGGRRGYGLTLLPGQIQNIVNNQQLLATATANAVTDMAAGKCPLNMTIDQDTGQCDCPAGTVLSNTKGCVTEQSCPPTQSFDADNGLCVQSRCPGGQTWDDTGTTCVPCPYGANADGSCLVPAGSTVSTVKKKDNSTLLLLAAAAVAAFLLLNKD